MHTYFALFLIATIASLILTPVTRRLCQRFSLLDVPLDRRRMHSKAVPRLGGVAIYLSVVIALSTLPLVDNLLTQTLRGYSSAIFVTFMPATLVLLVGIYDDLRGANATAKLSALVLISTLFFIMGGRIEGLTLPFLGSVQLPLVLSYSVTVLWLVRIANAFNLIDGMDGLASGAALFSSLVILAISFAQGQPLMIVFSLTFCGALAGFLRYNFNPASIFLGDSGALFVGFTLAALSVIGSQKATTTVAVVIPVLAFGLPVVDTGVTIARRLISGKPIFQGDNEHIHHMLIARGWSQQRAALVLYGACAAFGLVAILFTSTSSPLIGLALLVLTVVTIIGLGHLHYHEVEELKAGVKRTVGDRRIRVANNLRVRRASVALTEATTLSDLFDAIAVMLESEEFTYANIHLRQQGGEAGTDRVFRSSANRRPDQQLQLRDGRIVWTWKLAGVDESGVLGGNEYWCFRIPLANDKGDWGWMNLYREFNREPLLLDMNYIFGFLRADLTAAASRILQTFDQRKTKVGTSSSASVLRMAARKSAG
jgi:UDP-GlcNAc:undecaprenyl-phosphate/decaprenyl-phosphate GlcNAc-1-phosphate transferase